MKGDDDMYGRIEDLIKLIPMLVLLFVVVQMFTSGWNPAMMLLNTTQANPSAINECSNIQNQMQSQIDQLNRDITSCKEQSVCGFQTGTFILGMLVSGAFALFLFEMNNKKRNEFFESQIKSLFKKKKTKKK